MLPLSIDDCFTVEIVELNVLTETKAESRLSFWSFTENVGVRVLKSAKHYKGQ